VIDLEKAQMRNRLMKAQVIEAQRTKEGHMMGQTYFFLVWVVELLPTLVHKRPLIELGETVDADVSANCDCSKQDVTWRS
jgi:hypothetical protein